MRLALACIAEQRAGFVWMSLSKIGAEPRGRIRAINIDAGRDKQRLIFYNLLN
jgi:hypothetical protein